MCKKPRNKTLHTDRSFRSFEYQITNHLDILKQAKYFPNQKHKTTNISTATFQTNRTPLFSKARANSRQSRCPEPLHWPIASAPRDLDHKRERSRGSACGRWAKAFQEGSSTAFVWKTRNIWRVSIASLQVPVLSHLIKKMTHAAKFRNVFSTVPMVVSKHFFSSFSMCVGLVAILVVLTPGLESGQEVDQSHSKTGLLPALLLDLLKNPWKIGKQV